MSRIEDWWRRAEAIAIVVVLAVLLIGYISSRIWGS